MRFRLAGRGVADSSQPRAMSESRGDDHDDAQALCECDDSFVAPFFAKGRHEADAAGDGGA